MAKFAALNLVVLPTPHVFFAAVVFNPISHNPFVYGRNTIFDSSDDDSASDSEYVEIISFWKKISPFSEVSISNIRISPICYVHHYYILTWMHILPPQL